MKIAIISLALVLVIVLVMDRLTRAIHEHFYYPKTILYSPFDLTRGGHRD